MKGPKVKDWVRKTYEEVKQKVKRDANAHSDPTLWTWFREIFELEYGNIIERREVLKALLKLRMSKGDVEAYIEHFEDLRKSAKRPRDSLGTLLLRPSPRRSRCRALSVEPFGSREVRSGRPSCRATQGQNLYNREALQGSGESGKRPEDRGCTRQGNRSRARLPTKDLVLVQKIKPRA
jgi:hypothetical protein